MVLATGAALFLTALGWPLISIFAIWFVARRPNRLTQLMLLVIWAGYAAAFWTL